MLIRIVFNTQKWYRIRESNPTVYSHLEQFRVYKSQPHPVLSCTTWCSEWGSNPQTVRFKLTRYANSLHRSKLWRKVDELNAYGSSPYPAFRGQLPTIGWHLPWRKRSDSNGWILSRGIAEVQAQCLSPLGYASKIWRRKWGTIPHAGLFCPST